MGPAEKMGALFFAAAMLELMCWLSLFLLIAPLRRRRLQRRMAAWPPPEVR